LERSTDDADETVTVEARRHMPEERWILTHNVELTGLPLTEGEKSNEQ
jgi:hypothetical protein